MNNGQVTNSSQATKILSKLSMQVAQSFTSLFHWLKENNHWLTFHKKTRFRAAVILTMHRSEKMTELIDKAAYNNLFLATYPCFELNTK